MANFTLPSFPRSPRPTPPRDALAAAMAELKARLDAASVSFPRLSSAAGLHLVDSHADALALAASLADGDVVLVGGTSWYYVESHALVPFDPSGADARLAALEAKVPPEASPSNQLADRAYIATALAAIVGGAPEAYDTLKEIADWIADDESGAAKIVADVLALQAGKRGLTDLSVGDGWLLVKPDGAQVWLASNTSPGVWAGGGFELLINKVGTWALLGDSLDLETAAPADVASLEFSDGSSVYHLVRGSRFALDTEIPPAQVNADWNAVSGPAQILNKPTIPPAVTVDDTVTRTSANPVKSSGIWSAIWGALTALPTGFTALYDWVVAQLAGKRGLDDLAVYESGWVLSVPGGGTVSLVKPFPSANQWESGESVGDYAILHFTGTAQWTLFTIVHGSQTPQEVASVLVEDGDPDDVEFLDFGSGYSARFAKAAAPTSDTLAKTSQIPAVPSAATDDPLMDGAANAGTSANYARSDHRHPTDTTRASAADLRYRIAEAGFKHQFAASAFPITYTDTSTSTPVTITAGNAGDITWDIQPDGGAYVSYNGFDFAYFSRIGDYGRSQPGIDLQFHGVAAADAGKPLVQTVADRTVNLIMATDETSIDIELPAAVDGVRYCRDLILDINNSANASDLALEFTALGVDYAFVPLEGDSISEMTSIGAGEIVRLYFTETPHYSGGASLPLPVIQVARVTLGDFVTSTTSATQGGN